MSRARRERRNARRTGLAKSTAPAPARLVTPASLWLAIGLVTAVVVAYWPAHSLGFTKFDDPLYVTANPHIANGLTWSMVPWAFAAGYAANWHPLTWFSHALDVQLFGLDAGPHHVENVIIHALTTVVLFAALVRMTGALWRSAFVAALFGVHPIHVESVAWIAERKDVLSGLFWMLTLWAYASYARKQNLKSYAWVVAWFTLGLMAKPMVVTLPFVLLLLDVWPLRRVEFGPGWRSTMKAVLREKVPLFALSIASSVITFLAQREGGTVASTIRLPLSERLGNALIAYAAYIEKMVWPAHLAAYYPYPRTLPVAETVVSAVFLLVVTIAAIALFQRGPYLLIGWLWYLGTLVPAIGIVQVGTQAMADRYTYLPLIGLFIAVTWGAGDLLDRWKQAKVPAMVAATAALVACVVVSRVQVGYWQGSPTLWRHALDVTTDNYAAHTYYGNALAAQGKTDAAIAEYGEALRIRPDYPEAHNNLGPVLAAQGKLDEAIEQFREAIRLRPNYADAYSNLGVALASQGKWDQAVVQYNSALRFDPDHARARANLQLALRAMGK